MMWAMSKVQTADKVADDEVIQAHGEGHDGAGDDTGHDLMEGHLEEGLQRGAAQIHGSIRQGVVHLLEFRHHIQDDVGQIEGDVGDQQRPEGQGVPLAQHFGAHENEQQ